MSEPPRAGGFGEQALPPLVLADWRPTRDRLHRWARYAGAVRRQLSPPRPHAWHSSLLVSARGLTTGPFPVPGGAGEVVLDMIAGHLLVYASDGWELRLPLATDSGGPLRERLAAALGELEVDVELPIFEAPAPDRFDSAAAARYLHVLACLDAVLRALRSEVELQPAGHGPRGVFSPVQLWPHHFDLALTWFSQAWLGGGVVEDRDPPAAEEGDERVGLGFSTGDEGDPDAYLYATCHPWPDGVETRPLAAGRWHSAGWRGAFLPWREAAAAPSPLAVAARFWRGARAAFAPALEERRADGGPVRAVLSADPLAEPPGG